MKTSNKTTIEVFELIVTLTLSIHLHTFIHAAYLWSVNLAINFITIYSIFFIFNIFLPTTYISHLDCRSTYIYVYVYRYRVYISNNWISLMIYAISKCLSLRPYQSLHNFQTILIWCNSSHLKWNVCYTFNESPFQSVQYFKIQNRNIIALNIFSIEKKWKKISFLINLTKY